ncbi:MAG: branched-chain amino acid ABC transporter permease [Betaproteobacteria bacterium]|nr:branched-chain amino acid ABC transporter permease [Betaproteobacteria bacterium]
MRSRGRGLQFLVAVGVTLVFGVMRLINFAHGAMFMVAGYFSAAAYRVTGSFLASVVIALAGVMVTAVVLEVAIIRPLYRRGHLDQLLATFGVTIFLNELVVVIWGRDPIFMQIPTFLSGQIEMFPGVPYPMYRIAITVVAALAGLALYWLLSRTRVGMLIRAGADNRSMVAELGANIVVLYTFIFALGAVLAGLAGLMIGPLVSMQPGMGDPVLILALTVVAIGGVGSIRGALLASLLVGILDTFGRILMPQVFGAAGNALANMLVYVVMAAVLIWRPAGLLPNARA